MKSLSRAKFEQLADQLFKRAMDPVKQAMKDAGISASEIDEVILVGGSTRIPKVQEEVEKFFGKAPSKRILECHLSLSLFFVVVSYEDF